MWNKDQLSNLDPSVIKNMQFSYKKAYKYRTILSLFGSIIILFLTILLSLDSLKSLWKERSQLLLSSYEYFEGNATTTQTPLCAVSLDKEKTFYSNFSVLGKIVPELTREELTQKYPYMLKYLAGRQYYCYQFSQIRLSINPTPKNEDKFQINQSVFINASNYFEIYIKTITYEEVMKFKTPFVSNLKMSKSTQNMLLIKVKKYSTFLIQESVWKGVPPLQYRGISMINLEETTTSNVGFYMIFVDKTFSDNNVDKYNMIKLKAQRGNIFEIAGKVIAWYGTLLSIFLTLLFPIIEFEMKIELCKSIFSNQNLQSIQPSIYIQFKYYLAHLKTGIFVEQILISAFQRLDKQFDLITMLKKQLLMKQVHRQFEIVKDKSQLFVPSFQETYNDKILYATQSIKQSPSQTLLNLQPQEAQNTFFSYISQIISYFDGCQIEVGLSYKDGRGYASILSLIINVTGFGLLAFLILSQGILNISSQTIVYKQQILSNDSMVHHTIYPEDIIFSPIYYGFNNNLTSYVQILNNNYEIVRQIKLLYRQDCLRVSNSFNITFNLQHCLSESVELFYNPKTFERNYLRFRSCETLMCINQQDTGILSKDVIFINDQPEIRIAKSSSNPSVNNIFYQFQKFKQISAQSTNDYFNLMKVNKSNRKGNGIILLVGSSTTVFETTTKSLWDLANDVWGLTIIFFQFIIFKITRFVNNKVKSWTTIQSMETQRANILVIISNHNRLIHGFFQKHLDSIRYYFKQGVKLHELTPL